MLADRFPVPSNKNTPSLSLVEKVATYAASINYKYDHNKVVYYTTPDRGCTINAVSHNQQKISNGLQVLKIDPDEIDQIRYKNDVWEARFCLYTWMGEDAWHAIVYEDLEAGWPAHLLAKAKENPGKAVEQADGARGGVDDGPTACGLAHLPLDLSIAFRANRSGEAVSCVLAAYGNAIALGIGEDQKGLDAIRNQIRQEGKKLTCQEAGKFVRDNTGVVIAKIKMNINDLYPTLMTVGKNGKFMKGEGGLFVASPKTHMGSAGHMIAIDADQGLIYDCAEKFALPLTAENLDRCSGTMSMCVGFIRMRRILRPVPRQRGKKGGDRKKRRKTQKAAKAKKQKPAASA
jgi:hypothetical protein